MRSKSPACPHPEGQCTQHERRDVRMLAPERGPRQRGIAGGRAPHAWPGQGPSCLGFTTSRSPPVSLLNGNHLCPHRRPAWVRAPSSDHIGIEVPSCRSHGGEWWWRNLTRLCQGAAGRTEATRKHVLAGALGTPSTGSPCVFVLATASLEGGVLPSGGATSPAAVTVPAVTRPPRAEGLWMCSACVTASPSSQQ